MRSLFQYCIHYCKKVSKHRLPVCKAIPLVAASTLVLMWAQQLFEPQLGLVLLLLSYPLIIASAWFGGIMVGAFAMIFNVVAVDYYFLAPRGSWGSYSDAQALRIVLFVLNCTLLIWMISRLRQIEQRAGDLSDEKRETDLSFRAVVELSPYMIWYADENGLITYINKTAADYTGLAIESLTGEAWIDVIHPEDQERVLLEWAKSISSKSHHEIEFRIRRLDGAYRWFEIKAKPIFSSHGNVERWIGQCVDNHDRKLAILAHERAIAVRDRFMSLASHELRTPLTSIKLQMQTIHRQIKRSDEELLTFQHLQDVSNLTLKQVDQLDHLIEEMLDVSRISAGKMSFSFSPCSLSSIVDRAVCIVSAQYANAHVTLDLRTEENLNVVCDENKISQALINLLTNALKYGAGNPVQLIAKKEGNFARIEVIDGGRGIPQELQKRIFEPFERVDVKQSISGLGLGLYISREVIQAHKGRIHVSSKEKRGSKFVIEIPLMQSQISFFDQRV